MAYNILQTRLLSIALALGTVIGTIASAAVLIAPHAEAGEISPLFVQASGRAHPVETTDGQIHLVYELLLVNHGMIAVSIASIETLGTADEILQETPAEALRAQSRQSPYGGDGTVLQPSQSSIIFMDVALDAGAELPLQIGHNFTATLRVPEIGDTASFGGLAVETGGRAEAVSFRAAEVQIDPAPLPIISPPVTGDHWVIFRGCCDLATSHRGTTSFPGGDLQVAERFAIDFVRTNADGRMLSGPGNELASYVYIDDPVFAVADGTVVSARNDQPNQTPGAFPAGLDDTVASGNSVVLDIGGDRYALYAHMMPGSVTVKPGDAVKAGDQVGRLGNSGRTLGPHLHFHIMDDEDWRVADGMPYVFDEFSVEGTLSGDAFSLVLQGQPVGLDPDHLPSPHRDQHPLGNQQVGFGR